MSTAAQPDQALILNRSTEALFRPFQLKGLDLPNRIVMAPMTRSLSPGGVPGPDVAAYYRRRAEGGVGLIVTEGTFIDHPAAGFDPKRSRFSWRAGARRMAAGGRAGSCGRRPDLPPALARRHGRFAGLSSPGKPGDFRMPTRPGNMTQADIDAVIDAFAEGAPTAKELGFDGVELHGAHGYLIDQFFWDRTNQRTEHMVAIWFAHAFRRGDHRARFGRRVGPDFPWCFAVAMEIAGLRSEAGANARGIGSILCAAGGRRPGCVSLFDAPLLGARVSPGSDLNLAGWTKKLTGKP